MLDTSAFAEAVTHTSAWISKGDAKWGPHLVAQGHLARVQRDFTLDPRLALEVGALAALAKEAETGKIIFVETIDLQIERMRQPIGRFRGFGLFDRALDIHPAVLPSNESFVFTDSYLSKEGQIDRLRKMQDQPFADMLNFLQGHVLDTWHLHSCHAHNVPIFLTLDRKFARAFSHERRSKNFPRIMTDVLSPTELATRLAIKPLDLNALILEGSDFPTVPQQKAPHRRFGGRQTGED